MKVKEFIEHLSKFDPESIVTYAYDEYGRISLHGFFSPDELILVNEGNDPIEYEGEFIMCLAEDVNDQEEEIKELLKIPGNKWVPAVKLYPR